MIDTGVGGRQPMVQPVCPTCGNRSTTPYHTGQAYCPECGMAFTPAAANMAEDAPKSSETWRDRPPLF